MDIDWKDIPGDSKEKYALYLCSREWAELKRAVHERAAGKCERCGIRPIDAVHHLTYIRKYHELLADLQGICNSCHGFTHGKSDFDPRSETACASATWGMVDVVMDQPLIEQRRDGRAALQYDFLRDGVSIWFDDEPCCNEAVASLLIDIPKHTTDEGRSSVNLRLEFTRADLLQLKGIIEIELSRE